MNEEQVTIYRNFNIVDGQSTIKLIVDMIRRGDFASAIRELRQLRTMDETDADSANPESPNRFNSPDQFTQSREGDDELPF